MDYYDEMDDLGFDELDDQYEGDEFLPALGALLPIAAKAAPAIMSILGGLFEEESSSESFDEFDDGEGELAYDGDSYDELDDDFDGEDGIEDLEELELASQAKKSKSPMATQAAAGALAAKAASKAPPKLRKKIQKPLVKASSAIVKVLAKKPASKALIPAVPKILNRAVKEVKISARSGKGVSGKKVVRAVAKQTAKVLKSKPLLKSALKSKSLKRKVLNAQAISRAEKFV